MAEQPLSQGLLVLLMLGFAAHAVWRLAQAVGDREHAGDGAKGLVKRAGYAALALWYAGLAWLTGSVAFGHRASTNEKQARAASSAGRWAVSSSRRWASASSWQRSDRSSSFCASGMSRSATGEAGPEARRVVDIAGTVGYSARALVFAVIGVFLIRAAWEHDPSETIGLTERSSAWRRRRSAPSCSRSWGPASVATPWAALQARYRST